MTIKILVTGGTFDKEYNELNGSLFFKETHVLQLLKQSRCKLDTALRTLMLIDSLDMSDADRAIILEVCKKSKEDKIIITHGTDTMVETATMLGKEIKDKTIVLTGAMVPIVFGSSDGLFNLGCAVAFVQSLPPGVYITMNGRLFNWSNVKKVKEAGIFEEV